MLPKPNDGKMMEAADLHAAIATLVSNLGCRVHGDGHPGHQLVATSNMRPSNYRSLRAPDTATATAPWPRDNMTTNPQCSRRWSSCGSTGSVTRCHSSIPPNYTSLAAHHRGGLYGLLQFGGLSSDLVHHVSGILPTIPFIDQEFIKELHDSSITKTLHSRLFYY